MVQKAIDIYFDQRTGKQLTLEQFTDNYLNNQQTRNTNAKLPQGFRNEPEIDAFINQGRWVIRCLSCPSALAGDPDFPFFYCLECFNINYANMWLPVRYPDIAERMQIEKLLDARPNKINQNWYPHEDLRKLMQENIEHIYGN